MEVSGGKGSNGAGINGVVILDLFVPVSELGCPKLHVNQVASPVLLT